MNEVIFKPHEGAQTLSLSISDTYETLYGGARGGGKTMCGLAWLLRGTENPKYRALVIRRNAEDLADWVDRARAMYPHAKVTGKPATITFPSGAVIRCGHLKDENAYEKYQGHEYHRIVIEELTQIPNEESYLKLVSSCRSTVEGLSPRVFCTANPGGKGHQWVKNRFIDGHTAMKSFKDTESGRKRIYIPATIDDNPTLVNHDPDYVKYLESLPEPLRSAWRFGDWDVFAGQYFIEWNPNVHVIDEQKAIELGYEDSLNRRYMGIDWGFANPFCALWCQVTHKNTVFFYDELYGTERHPVQWAEMIWAKSKNQEINQIFGDPSMWARNPMSWKNPSTQSYTDKSIADAFTTYLPNLVPANNSRIIGWQNMSQMMHFNKKTLPKFFIIKGKCPNLERTLPNMVRDDKNPEDLDTTTEDHAVDACRYALTHILAPTQKRIKEPVLQQQINKLLMPEPEDDTVFDWNNI